MVTGFENYTAALTPYELEMLIPVLTEGLKKRVGAKRAIRNKDICRILTARGYEKVTEARMRKCINYIRMNGLVPHLIANSNGYYVATSVDEVQQYAESLKERASAIWAMRTALINQLSGKLFL